MDSKTIICNHILSFLQKYASLMDYEYLVKICMTSYSAKRNQEAINIMRYSVLAKFKTPASASISDQLHELVDIFRRADPRHSPTFVDSSEDMTEALRKHLSREDALSTFKALQWNIVELMMYMLTISEKGELKKLLAPQPFSGTNLAVLKNIGINSEDWKNMTPEESRRYAAALVWLRENVRQISKVQKAGNEYNASTVQSRWQEQGAKIDIEGLIFMLDPKKPEPGPSKPYTTIIKLKDTE